MANCDGEYRGIPRTADYQDALIARRAVKNRWPMSAEARADVVRQMHAMVNGAEDERARVNAARVLTTVEAQNQADEHKAAEIKASTTNAMIGKLSAEQLIQLAQELKAQQSLQTPQITQVNIVEDASNAGGA